MIEEEKEALKNDKMGTLVFNYGKLAIKLGAAETEEEIAEFSNECAIAVQLIQKELAVELFKAFSFGFYCSNRNFNGSTFSEAEEAVLKVMFNAVVPMIPNKANDA